ncbi:MAG: histidine--tRNA ligase [Saprospiraceae bacterium]|nr:histidine--tRNA ligase [Saprospiraceae bacterium]
MAQKPSIPKGTRDFSPVEMARRNYIFDTIKEVFQICGYQPIETPAMENLSTLLGKYGEEGDKLLFKVLNSGDYLSKVQDSGKTIAELDSNKISMQISEKGLRYDLTVPFARYVVQNRNDITFPFKRFQIQTVWRADRPQKGRYREFFQCDADVIGSYSLLNEVELVQIIDTVFNKLKISATIKLNNRKILAGIAELVGESDKIIDITVAIDKLDKIGIEKVNEELIAKGIPQKAIDQLQPIINLQGSTEEKIKTLKETLKDSEVGVKGISEIEQVFNYLQKVEINSKVELDLTLARGLNYYTGAIIEVVSNDVKMGSICGGGRYDDLTGIFGLPDVSGVGISFGADRIYDVLNELKLFPENAETSTQVMFVNFGAEEEIYCLPLVNKLRQAGIKAELYPDSSKLKRQMNYANNKNIPFVVIVGSEEIETGELTVKNMTTGKQQKLEFGELLDRLLAD